MIQQTIFPFKIETMKERLTDHRGLALMAQKKLDKVSKI